MIITDCIKVYIQIGYHHGKYIGMTYNRSCIIIGRSHILIYITHISTPQINFKGACIFVCGFYQYYLNYYIVKKLVIKHIIFILHLKNVMDIIDCYYIYIFNDFYKIKKK